MLDQLIPEDMGKLELFQLAEGQCLVVEQPERIAAMVESNVE